MSALTLLMSQSVGHFAMNKPCSWLDADCRFGMKGPTKNVHGIPCSTPESCGWRAAGCTSAPPPPGEEPVIGCISQWYSNGTTIPGEPTLDDKSPMLTYIAMCNSLNPVDRLICAGMRNHPWRAPGSAKVWSPCGIDGGNPKGCPVGNPARNGCAAGGYGHGPDGRTLAGNTKPAEWKIGGQEEVAYGVTANHGGGYAYRLCPKPANSMDLTEECFQKHHLDFVGNTQWLQLGADESNRTAVPAMRTSEGTFPANSQWTRNPIPACKGPLGGGGTGGDGGACSGSQFPPPLPGVYGFYAPTLANPFKKTRLDSWSVVDKVHVPASLPAGDYVLSYRIDCEQTPQVWNQCADVRLVA